MHAALPLVKDLVLVGGGHAHALVLRRLGMKPVPGLRLTLINPDATAPYTGMLPGFVAGHYGRDDLEIDLVRLARFAGARLIFGKAQGIDRAAKTVSVAGRPPIRYDRLSIDIGITSDMPDLPGFTDHGVAAKPLARFADRWSAYRASARDGALPQVAILGGGVAGLELALAMHHALKNDTKKPAEITVIEAKHAGLALQPSARRRLRDALFAAGITLREGVRAAEVTASHVRLSDDTTVASTLTIGAAGARPYDWLRDTGLDLTDGYITVDRYLRSVTDPAIYGAGDCIHFAPDPRPKAGVYAVRAAPVLTRNLIADLTGAQRQAYVPQKDFLKLISLGDKRAIADKWGQAFDGAVFWRLKNHIDQSFMTRLNHPPAMTKPAVPKGAADGLAQALNAAPLCGGCGAKVGPGTLKTALAALPAPTRADILSGPGDDAAVLRVGNATQVMTTDHLRAFTDDPWTLARITAIHAMGDIWAMNAAPQAAVLNVILPKMSEAMQASTMAEILDGAQHALREAGAELVGGHSTLGAELTIGFTLTGLAMGTPIGLNGAQPGDAVILTKPLGSGVLLAAEMNIAAQGPDIVSLYENMAQPQAKASELLSNAHAMTDVTGFGLAGHLMAICEASNVGATLRLNDIPLYAGAEAALGAGIRSSLHPGNRAVAAQMSVPDTVKAEALFDPQTSGGLLACLPEAQAAACLNNLKSAGYTAAIIGQITDESMRITVT